MKQNIILLELYQQDELNGSFNVARTIKNNLIKSEASTCATSNRVLCNCEYKHKKCQSQYAIIRLSEFLNNKKPLRFKGYRKYATKCSN